MSARTRFSRTVAIRWVALLLTMAMAAGCYWTKLRTDARGRRAEYSRHQVFLLYGLIPLSGAAGDECGDAGISSAESGVGALDILLEIGMQVGATLVAGQVCKIPPNATNEEITRGVACFSALQFGAGLFATRTVTYHCAIREGSYEPQTQNVPLPRPSLGPSPDARTATRTISVHSETGCRTEDRRTGRAGRAKLDLPPDDELCAKLKQAIETQLVRSGFVVTDGTTPRRFTAVVSATRTIESERQGRTYAILNDIAVTLTLREGTSTVARAEARGDGADADAFARDAARTLVEQVNAGISGR